MRRVLSMVAVVGWVACGGDVGERADTSPDAATSVDASPDAHGEDDTVAPLDTVDEDDTAPADTAGEDDTVAPLDTVGEADTAPADTTGEDDTAPVDTAGEADTAAVDVEDPDTVSDVGPDVSDQDPDVTPQGPSCAAYCAAVVAACSGANAQYADEQTCMAYCATWAAIPAGVAGAKDGDTIGCRTYHAELAATDDAAAAVHCVHAGPSGGGVCGTWCDNYCDLALKNCVGSDALYDSAEDCATACLALNAGGSAGSPSGDSVQCRIYHLGVAGSDGAASAAIHCPHGGPSGGGVCVCEPDCAGKVCGDDGCGGTCGACLDGQLCSDDHTQCVFTGCAGSCGDQAPSGCWCDTVCFAEGDCCPDVCDSCAEELPAECAPPSPDDDHDGWTVADGDCCDAVGCADHPELVNPGALEVPGNGVDDDCRPATSDLAPYPTCSSAADAATALANASTATSSTQLVQAMDLCVFTSESPAPAEKTWGVISSSLTLADGTVVAPPTNLQVGVLPSYGPNVLPQYGETLVALSSGTARRPGDPGYVQPQNGASPGQLGNYNAQTECPVPADYLTANGGVLPRACGECVGPSCNTAYDSVALRVRLRPPTNARSFSYRLNYYSAEFPEFVCDAYSDTFITLLSGGVASTLPADKNVVFDAGGHPISAGSPLVQVCFPPVGAPPGTCSQGTLELVGTGMGGWNGSLKDGAATGWLQNDVPLPLKQNPNNPGDPSDLIPTGEPFEIQFILWDSGDHNVDSLVLLDRFRWNLAPAALSTHD